MPNASHKIGDFVHRCLASPLATVATPSGDAPGLLMGIAVLGSPDISIVRNMGEVLVPAYKASDLKG